ncbi:MAG: MaoC/PaaZ C-terminal domain-containing protein [Chloroflexota bacterium]
MGRQVYYEDVTEGMEVPILTKHPTKRQLVMWAGASGDFYDIHYDKDFAQRQGLQGVIVHGRLKAAFMGQLLTDWIGADGSLRKLTCRYKGMDMPGEDLTVRGQVTRKFVENGENLVDLEVWTENPGSGKTTTGSATVALPSRNGDAAQAPL